MKVAWNYLVVAALTIAAAAAVAGGEPGVAELKLVEASSSAAGALPAMVGWAEAAPPVAPAR